MKNWWKRLQDRRVPKIRMGGKVKIMYGDQVVGIMVLTSFEQRYDGDMRAKLVDAASYAAGNRVS
jgi:hypothetical protein